MQSGKLGVIVVMIALVGTILTGFLANVQTVTVETTQWEYYTDVAGAFTSEDADLYSDFNPSTNVTGWSGVDSSYNDRELTGVKYTSSYPNEFYIHNGQATVYSISCNIIPNVDNPRSPGPNVVPQPSWVGLFSGDQSWQTSGYINGYQGLNGPQNTTVYERTAIDPIDGAAMVSMADLIGSLEDKYPDLSTIKMNVGEEDDALFISKNASADYDETTFIWSDYYREYIYTKAEKSSHTLQYDSHTGLITLNAGTFTPEQVSVMWSVNDYNETSNHDLTIGIVLYADQDIDYVNAASGIQPSASRIDTSYVQTTEVNASSVTMHLTGTGPWVSQGPLLYDGTSSDSSAGSLAFTGSEWTYTPIDGTAISVGSGDSLTMVITSTGIVMGSYTHTFTTPLDGIATVAMSVDIDDLDNFAGTYSYIYGGLVSETMDLVPAFSNLFVFDTKGVATVVEEQSTLSTSAWWNNGYSNQALSLVFQRPSEDVSQAFTMVGSDQSGSFIVSYDGQWSVQMLAGGFIPTARTLAVGDWPGIILSVDFAAGVVSLSLIENMVNFTDYTTLAASPTVLQTMTLDQTIDYIEFTDLGTIQGDDVVSDPSFRLMVTDTRVLIAQGGYYMVDATIDTGSAFGDLVSDRAVSISFDSFGRIGSAIAVNGIQYQVDAEASTISIGDKNVPLARTMAVFIPASMSAWYYNGSVYDSGHAYLVDSRQSVVDLGEATTLDVELVGTWLAVANMSLGDTVAQDVTQWGGSDWSLDMSGTVVIFLGLSALGAIIAKWKLDGSMMDLVIIGGAMFFALAILG